MMLVAKNPPTNAGKERDVSLILGLGKIPWRRTCQPSSVLMPGESHGQRSPESYIPSGHKESDTTEAI